MAQGIVELNSPTGIDFMEALEEAANEAFNHQEGKASQFKVVLVCPQFNATPLKVVVDTDTKQVEIHFDF